MTTLPPCPTLCDEDCELNPDGCHESHKVRYQRGHQPWACEDIRRAIAEAVKAERERLLNGPVTRIEPDPDQPGCDRGVFDIDAAVAQAVARERERIVALARQMGAIYPVELDPPAGHTAKVRTSFPFADYLEDMAAERQGATDG